MGEDQLIEAMEQLVGKQNVTVFKTSGPIKDIFKNGELFYSAQIIIGMLFERFCECSPQ